MLPLRRTTATAAILAATLVVQPFATPLAFADDKSIAEQLFVDAKKLMDEGKAKEACPKLEESMRLDPADGTQLRLATCYEMMGRYATAWTMFREGLARAKKANNAQRLQFATEHLAVVEPKVSKVTITIDDGSKDAGLEVKMDGAIIGAAGLGTALPVDPGVHEVTATAPGKKPWAGSVTITTDAQMASLRVPSLDDAPTPTTASRGAPATAYVALGAGVVFLGGAIFGQVLAGSAYDDRKTACAAQTSSACDDSGKSKVRTWETVSFVSAGLSAVAFGVSIYLFTSTPKTESTATVSSLRIGIVPAAAPTFALEGAF
jgi:hypothetical protein